VAHSAWRAQIQAPSQYASQRIDSGRKGYLPGDRFPTEPQLIEESGYSRETVRAAIRVLRQEGLLDVTLGVGTFVAAREVWGRGAR